MPSGFILIFKEVLNQVGRLIIELPQFARAVAYDGNWSPLLRRFCRRKNVNVASKKTFTTLSLYLGT